jgi:DNA repair protein RadC
VPPYPKAAAAPAGNSTIRDLPEDDRPREKLSRLGAQSLSEPELLALFFGSGLPGMTAIELGRVLLEHFGSLRKLAGSSVGELSQIKGIGPAKSSQLAAVFELGRRLSRERLVERVIDSPETVYELLGDEMSALPYESLRAILLNTRSHLIKVEEVTRGGLNESVAHPREILRAALTHHAYSFILVHNHPSGDPSPSSADRALTKRLYSASEEIGIPLVDHVIIGSHSESRPEAFFSFAEAGLI